MRLANVLVQCAAIVGAVQGGRSGTLKHLLLQANSVEMDLKSSYKEYVIISENQGSNSRTTGVIATETTLNETQCISFHYYVVSADFQLRSYFCLKEQVAQTLW